MSSGECDEGGCMDGVVGCFESRDGGFMDDMIVEFNLYIVWMNRSVSGRMKNR
jgi:hypothetical protein